VKAAAFDYAKPSTVDEAIKLKARHGDGARFLAGGQSLLPALNLRLDKPDLLIDINGLSDLSGIAIAGDRLRIGALTRHAQIGRSDAVASAAPLLSRCVEHIAHPAIRTMGTFGGSLALADPAAEWPAACLALDARLVAIGPEGERMIEARDYFQGLYATALMTDELLLRIEIPISPPGARGVALELTRRRGDFAIVGLLAQAVPASGGTLTDVRTSFLGVSDRPLRLPALEKALSGRPDIEAARAAIDVGLKPTADLTTSAAAKLHLAKVLVQRAITQLSS
jgi:carbon-monoxide dehydrogenase medium subunit